VEASPSDSSVFLFSSTREGGGRERGEGESGVGGNDERGAKGQYDDDGKVRKKRHHSNCTIPACTSGAEYIQVALSIVSLKL
jgi:hypothetical protein